MKKPRRRLSDTQRRRLERYLRSLEAAQQPVPGRVVGELQLPDWPTILEQAGLPQSLLSAHAEQLRAIVEPYVKKLGVTKQARELSDEEVRSKAEAYVARVKKEGVPAWERSEGQRVIDWAAVAAEMGLLKGQLKPVQTSLRAQLSPLLEQGRYRVVRRSTPRPKRTQPRLDPEREAAKIREALAAREALLPVRCQSSGPHVDWKRLCASLDCGPLPRGIQRRRLESALLADVRGVEGLDFASPKERERCALILAVRRYLDSAPEHELRTLVTRGGRVSWVRLGRRLDPEHRELLQRLPDSLRRHLANEVLKRYEELRTIENERKLVDKLSNALASASQRRLEALFGDEGLDMEALRKLVNADPGVIERYKHWIEAWLSSHANSSR